MGETLSAEASLNSISISECEVFAMKFFSCRLMASSDQTGAQIAFDPNASITVQALFSLDDRHHEDHRKHSTEIPKSSTTNAACLLQRVNRHGTDSLIFGYGLFLSVVRCNNSFP